MGGRGPGAEARAGGADVRVDVAALDTGHRDGGAGANPIRRRISWTQLRIQLTTNLRGLWSSRERPKHAGPLRRARLRVIIGGYVHLPSPLKLPEVIARILQTR